jgi:hypothetical protein
MNYHAHHLRALGEKPELVPPNAAGFSLNAAAKSECSEEKIATLLHIGYKRRDQRTK